jgi:secreted PhoX family phosphatase
MPSPLLLRRQFLALNCGIAVAATLGSLACGNGAGGPGKRRDRAGYGPLQPAKDETTGLPLLHLPAGFRYLSFGWTGDPLRGGVRTPGAHDGMATFASSGSRIRLVRNHELRTGKAFAADPVYDRNGGGGTTTIEFDTESGAVIDSWVSLAGTAVNCAGGPTPWGSWLSCEETVLGPGGENAYGMPHGYVFEVPSDGSASAEPYRAMGRFVHEAVSVDPETGIVYETEDQDQAGFYRFIPAEPGRLASGGHLEMLALENRTGADTRKGQTPGAWEPVRWVPISEPDPDPIESGSVHAQGVREGGATFGRLEGTWHGNGRIYIVSTNGGDAESGQVWEYDPSGERLALLYESPGAEVLDMPDNICVSPRGGLVLCEDGEGEDYVRGLTTSGEIFPFAKNNVVLGGERNGLEGDFRDREFAGATYSPDGRWLFFNAQTPGISFAVTGPWEVGLI